MLAAMARAASVTGVAEVEGTGRFCGRGASVSDSDAMVAEGAGAGGKMNNDTSRNTCKIINTKNSVLNCTKMASSSYAYYAVRVGRKPGVYRDWQECGLQVDGFKGAVHKKFSTADEAYAFANVPRPAPVAVSNTPAQKAVAIAKVLQHVNAVHPVATARVSQSVAPPRTQTLQEAMREEDRLQGMVLAKEASEKLKAEANARDVARLQAQFKEPLRKRPAYTRPGHEEEEDGNNAPPPKRAALAPHARLPVTPTPGPQGAPDKNIDTVWTDGGAYHNGHPDAAAGIGVYWGPNDPRNVAAPLHGSLHTNQRAELSAALRAITDTAHYKTTNRGLLVYTDSEYTINCCTKWLKGWKSNGWKSSKGGAVMNQDLIKALDAAMQGRRVFFKHVAAHTGIDGNENADRLATKGIEMARAARRH